MRIAYVGGSYVPDRGADSVHVMAMCEAFAKNGHDVTLYARAGTEPIANDFAFYGVTPSFRVEKVSRPQVRVWGAVVNAWLVAGHVERARPELVFAREHYGLALAARHGVPFVYEVHWKPRHIGEQALFRWLFRQPNLRRLVFISARLRDLYRTEFPWLPEEKLLVAHDAANLPTSAIEPSLGYPARARMSVGYVGGFLPGYGIEVIVDLARRHSELDFHIVGGREPAVQEWRSRTAGVENLRFHGFVAPHRLAERYRDFDVVLAPYQRNTKHIDWISPMKLFEYMAHRKAIICADFPVMREILNTEENALLVPADDLEAYGRALARLADPVLRERLASNARLKLEAEFTWQARARHVLAGL